MLHFHIALSLELIALVAGTWLLVSSKHRPEGCSWLGKIIGFIVMIIALIMTICSIVCAVSMWHHGYGHMGMSMMGQTTSVSSTGGASSVGSSTNVAAGHHK